MLDVGTGAVVDTHRGHVGAVLGLVAAPDGETLWSAGRDATLIGWDLTGARRIPAVGALPVPAGNGWQAADAEVAVLWDPGPPGVRASVTVVDSGSGRTLFGPVPAGGDVNALTAAVTPDGTLVALGLDGGPDAETGSLRLLRVPGGETVAEVPLPWIPSGIAITSDGRTAVVNGHAGVARVDLPSATVVTQRELPAVAAYPQRFSSAEVSPDSRLVALARGGRVTVVDASTLDDVASWETDDYDDVLSMAWLDGGATLAHGGVQGTLSFRSVPDGELLGSPREVSPGFTLDLAANRAGTRLASLGTDGDVLLWDPVSHDAVGEPLVPPGELGWGWIRFGGNDSGEEVVASYESASTAAYPVDTDALVARACALAGREPTPAEWQAMHGDTPQRPTCGAAAG